MSSMGQTTETSLATDGPLDVVAIGEALVDFISEESARALDVSLSFGMRQGGQCANLARNVARLGGRSALVARVGADGFGAFIRSELDAAGVITSALTHDPRASTTLIVVTRTAGTPDFIVYRGADARLTPADLPLDALRRARAVHASTFALSHAPSRDTVLMALAEARHSGALVSLDPNYHERLWDEETRPLDVLTEAYRFVDVTKPSLDDCARLFGAGSRPEEYAQRFLALGPRIVVVTLGAEGALLATADGLMRRLSAAVAPVVDVTGAGDAFWSGLLLGLIDGLAPEVATCAGLEVARRKIQHVGPLVEPIERRDLYALASAQASRV